MCGSIEEGVGKVTKGAKGIDCKGEEDDTCLKKRCKVVFSVDKRLVMELPANAVEVSLVKLSVWLVRLGRNSIGAVCHSDINGNKGSRVWRGVAKGRRLD